MTSLAGPDAMVVMLSVDQPNSAASLPHPENLYYDELRASKKLLIGVKINMDSLLFSI